MPSREESTNSDCDTGFLGLILATSNFRKKLGFGPENIFLYKGNYQTTRRSDNLEVFNQIILIIQQTNCVRKPNFFWNLMLVED